MRLKLLMIPATILVTALGWSYIDKSNVSFSRAIITPTEAMNSCVWKPVVKDIVGPVGIATTASYPEKLFVLSQPGKVLLIDRSGSETQTPETILDLTQTVKRPNEGYDECGILGMAFHPDFKRNRWVFIHYSKKDIGPGKDHVSVLARFTMGSDFKLDNELEVLSVVQPEGNHNGGSVEFGPDKMLYLGLGDGGGQGDKHGTIGNSQNLSQLLGKILRIDVNQSSKEVPYKVPVDNPFVTREGARGEIFAYGFRNPWRFSFDKKTGRLWAGDVGQNEYEEVDTVVKGGNYGWRLKEGLHCYNPKQNCESGQKLIDPVAEYPHSVGVSVTGGYVYRGKNMPVINGYYVFGDWIGRLYFLTPPSGKQKNWQRLDFPKAGLPDMQAFRVNAFGQDADGELYLCAQAETGPHSSTGQILKLVAKE